MMAPTRIGLFTPAWPGHNTPNGIATAVYNLAMGLKEIGHIPVIIPMKLDGEGPPGIPVVPVPEQQWTLMGRVRARLKDLDAINDSFVRSISSAVQHAVQAHGMDVLIMEESKGWAQRIQSKTKIPIIVALHGPTALLRQFFRPDASITKYQHRNEARELSTFAAAEALLSPSRHVLDGVAALASVSNTPKAVIYNSFSAPRPDPLPATRYPRDILFVGRFDYLKGGDVLLEAFSYLIETHPHARMTFAGPDKGLERADGTLQSMAEALTSLPDAARARITYFGPASRDQVAELRSRHAIALIASRYENLNYSLLEAMAAGQAVVSTAVGGPFEVLADGQSALLVPSEDPAAMAAALGRLVANAALTERLGRNAVDMVQRDFNPAKIAAQTIDFVQTVLKVKQS